MARAAVKAKQQARAAAQPAKRARARSGGRRRGSGGGNPNQQLFFSRLRRQAKWMYVVLAVLFAITFAALGVGSGSSGLDQLFSGINIFGGGSGSSISQAQKEIKQHPNGPKGYRDLATAYEQAGKQQEAIAALQSYTRLRPKDADAFNELGGLQLAQGQVYAGQYQAAAAASQAASPSQAFLPTGTLGTAIGTNPIESSVSQNANAITSNLYTQAVSGFQAALQSYQTVARLRPHDASAAVQVASAAQQSGQTALALQALRSFLAANPTSSERPQVLQMIKRLTPPPTTPTKPAKKGK